MQDESISTINVYELERAARRQAYEECAAICEGERLVDGLDNPSDIGYNRGLTDASKAIRAKLETMP